MKFLYITSITTYFKIWELYTYSFSNKVNKTTLAIETFLKTKKGQEWTKLETTLLLEVSMGLNISCECVVAHRSSPMFTRSAMQGKEF